MSKILVVGSLNMDMVTRVDHTPRIGETISGETFDLIPGGKGANQAVAIGKLGGQVELIGAIGNDENGIILREALNKIPVINNRMKVSQTNPTGIAFIMVNKSGDNSIVVIPGANDDLDKDLIKETYFEDVSLLLCQLETPLETVHHVLTLAKKLKVKTVLNPAPYKNLSDELLSKVDILIANEIEFEALTGLKIDNKADVLAGFEQLHEKGLDSLIVTLGARGACYYDGENFIESKAKKVKVVDTTAAGDSFIAGFCEGLTRGLSIEKSLEQASRVAAITVTRFGAQSSLPWRREL